MISRSLFFVAVVVVVLVPGMHCGGAKKDHKPGEERGSEGVKEGWGGGGFASI